MNKQQANYRHELKYPVSGAQILLLESRIRHLMQPDAHTDGSGMYTIRSLYFDDYENRCYYENENGTDPREKFRIRIYDHKPEPVTLECKRKERGKTLKSACRLTREQAESLIRGQCLPITEDTPQLLRYFLIQMRLRRLRPAVIVEYERRPYVFRNGNVRITFDTNVTSVPVSEDFFAPRVSGRPIMPAGEHLMEVKFDEYLPDHLYRSLNLNLREQTAYSKYYLCRKFSLKRRSAT